MDITPFIPENRFQIRGYGNGAIRINDGVYTSAVLLTPFALLTPDDGELAAGRIPSPAELFPEAQQMIQQHSILLLGSGVAFPEDAACITTEYVAAFGRAPDIMDTGAACRTFNVLAGEERDVCALLLPV